jgi:hypothetical protein
MLDKIVNFFLVHAAIVLPLAVALLLVVSSSARGVFKTLLRVLARPLLIVAVIALAYDGTRTLAGGSGLVVTSVADHWANLAPKSIETVRALVSTRLHPALWDSGITPLVRLPAWLVAGVLGLLLGWIGRRRRDVRIFVN